MENEQENINTDKTPETIMPKTGKRFRINYLWLVRHLPFILYLSFLALLYIANGHYADKNIRAINKTRNELKELRWQYLNIKSDLMFRSKMSEIDKAVAPLGLEELNTPPQEIIIDTTK